MVDRHKQQIKRDRQDLKRRAINSQNKSKMRTLINIILEYFQKGNLIVPVFNFDFCNFGEFDYLNTQLYL